MILWRQDGTALAGWWWGSPVPTLWGGGTLPVLNSAVLYYTGGVQYSTVQYEH